MVKLIVVGSSPAWPNPGARSLATSSTAPGGLLDCGLGVLARLRESESWPRLDAIVITHFHLDHWGDSRALGLGDDVPLRRRRAPNRALAPAGRARSSRAVRARLGTEDMFERTFDCREYKSERVFSVRDLEIVAVPLPHYGIATYGLRDGRPAHAGVLGRLRPERAARRAARDADLFVCEATLESPEADGDLRGHLAPEEVVASFEASGAKRLLVTHRPRELEPLNGYEEAYDGLEIDTRAIDHESVNRLDARFASESRRPRLTWWPSL